MDGEKGGEGKSMSRKLVAKAVIGGIKKGLKTSSEIGKMGLRTGSEIGMKGLRTGSEIGMKGLRTGSQLGKKIGALTISPQK